MSTTPPTLTSDQLIQAIQLQATQSANTAGMTNVAPQVPNHQVPQPQPFQKQPQQPIRPVGPGQGGAMKQQQQQNFATSISNIAGSIVSASKQRQARQQQVIFDNFASYYKGSQDAQGAMQQAMADLKKNPQDADAQQRFQKAKASYDQNIQNINDLTTGKNEKNVKLLSKGFGIDDKNAGTPERQAAIGAIKKQMPGLGGNAAGLMSKMPQTQQLTPQAQGQQMARQAGVGSPQMTENQRVQALEKLIQQNKIDERTQSKLDAGMIAKGYVPEKGEDGKTSYRQMTTEERADNPKFRAEDEMHQARLDFMKAQTAVKTDPNNVQNQLRALEAQARMIQSKASMERADAAIKAIAAGNSDELAQMLINGDIAPAQIPGRNSVKIQAIENASKLSGGTYSAAKADSDFTFAKNTGTQNTLKYLNSLTGRDNQSGNLGELIRLSGTIKRTQYPPVNDTIAWARLQSGDPKMAAYRGVVVEVADQVAKILQGGSGSATSDAKMRQAAELFAKGFNNDQVKEVSTELRTLLANRKKELVGDNKILQKQYGSVDASADAGGDTIHVSPEDMN